MHVVLWTLVLAACGDEPASAPDVLAWAHTKDEVVTMPVVVDLDGDGVPEVIVNTMKPTGLPVVLSIGVIVCLDGRTGAERWRIPHDPERQQFGASGRATVAAGDVDGDGAPDIIYAGLPTPGAAEAAPIHAVDGAGKLLWTSRHPNGATARARIGAGAPALVNLDDDPQAEIAFGATIYDHDGLMVWDQDGNGGSFGSPHMKGDPDYLLYAGGLPTFADLTGDGYPELITGREAWTIDWVPGAPPMVTLARLWRADSGVAGDGYPAIADLDGNGTPEVVLTAWPEIKILDGATGRLWCGVDPTGEACAADDARRTPPIQVPGGNLGGPAVIADFDGDGRPEFGIATDARFVLFDVNRAGEVIVTPEGAPSPAPGAIFTRWAAPTQDKSSATTGASAFDFEGDGIPEVLYQDECFARVFDGATGVVKVEIMNSSLTGHEYPVPADVDGDGDAEMVVVANLSQEYANAACRSARPDFVTRKGVYVYRAEVGVPTGSAWTMHSYHGTNVGEDGHVPVTEQDHWKQPGDNGFRQGRNL